MSTIFIDVVRSDSARVDAQLLLGLKGDTGDSAYEYAVAHGYDGTEYEYGELMASYATVAEDAAESASEAEGSASAASDSATDAASSASAAAASATEASGYASNAQTSASAASGSATSAEQSAVGAAASASSAASASNSASQSANSATASATSAAGSAESASASAGDAETSAQSASQSAEDAASSAQTAEDARDTILGMTIVTDVEINGSSIVADGVANIPLAGSDKLGVVKASYGRHTTSVDTYNAVELAFEGQISGRTATHTLATVDSASITSRGLMSKADKIKLNGIADGAEVNVQADWNVANASSDAYIKNKPTLFSGDYNDLENKPDIPSKTSDLDNDVPFADMSTISALLPTDTASGSIASFPDGQNIIPALSVKTEIEPIQSGSGTPSPDNVRPISGRTEVVTWDDPKYGGTIEWNQLLTNTQPTRTINGVTFTNNEDGTYTVNGTATADATFALSGGNGKPAHKVLLCGCPTGGSPSSYILWDGYAGWFDSGNGTVKPFSNSGNWGTLITVKSGITVNNIVFKPQLFDLTQMFGSTIADYIYSLEQAHAGDGVAYFRNLFPNDYYEYNAGETTCVSAVNGDPYNHYTTSLGRTVYGGTLDVVSGELVVDRVVKTVAECGFIWQGANNRFYTSSLKDDILIPQSTSTNLICEALPAVPDGTPLAQRPNNAISVASSGNVFIANPTYTSKQDLESAIGTTKVSYELKEPTTIQLTPTEIALLKGQNNVWTDSGEVEVTYKADIGKYVDKKITELQALVLEQ